MISNSRFPIFEAYDTKQQKALALKVFLHKNKGPSNSYKNEARFQETSHPHIVSIVKTQANIECFMKGKIVNVSTVSMELAPYRDSAGLISTLQLYKSEKLIRTYFHQMIEGIEYLHSKGIYHMDIKCANLLLGEDFKLKVTDFALSYMNGDSCLRGTGTKNYRAPELLERAVTDHKNSDIYSAGIVLFAMMAGFMPYSEDKETTGYELLELLKKQDGDFWKILKKLIPMKISFGKDFKKLFFGMINSNPEERMTIADIKKSKWYKGSIYSEKKLAKVMTERIKKAELIAKKA